MDRFLGHVIAAQGGCWVWTAHRLPAGYGVFSVGSRSDGTRKNVKAHRFSYESMIGPVPPGLVLDHLCRNRACVNPRHLEPVTTKENIRRGERATKTRCLRGHLLAGDNLLPYAKALGWRACRRCKQMKSREGYHGRSLPL
jgi:hypothetical protein